jgi:hypothetical protein
VNTVVSSITSSTSSSYIRYLGREVQFRPHDLFEHGLSVAAIEGRQTDDHLVEQRPERPPVDGSTMTFSSEHLGGNVLRGSAEGVGTGGVVRNAFLAKAEVREPHIAVLVQQNILGLQISAEP